jgi:hypothetical protein
MPNTWNIKIHSNGNATPSTQHVNVGDTVTFDSDKGSWSVDFGSAANSPFTPIYQFNGAQDTPQSGTVTGAPSTTPYKYTSCCTPSGGSQACQDPDIVIDSSPLPHTGKKY